MIIERDDYITQEELDKYAEIIDIWNERVNEFMNTDFTLESYSRSYSSYLRSEKDGFIIRNRGFYSSYHDTDVIITKEQCMLYGIYNKLNSLLEDDHYHSARLKNEIKSFARNYEDVKTAAEMYSKYKHKTVKINKYNYKDKFKDIYEVIKTVEDKYE